MKDGVAKTKPPPPVLVDPVDAGSKAPGGVPKQHGLNDLDAPTSRNHFEVMTTTTVLKKWGKGIALVLPDTLVKAGRLTTGNEVEVNLTGQRIKIRKTVASKEIDEICATITPGNLHAETPWGEPQGREVW